MIAFAEVIRCVLVTVSVWSAASFVVGIALGVALLYFTED